MGSTSAQPRAGRLWRPPQRPDGLIAMVVGLPKDLQERQPRSAPRLLQAMRPGPLGAPPSQPVARMSLCFDSRRLRAGQMCEVRHSCPAATCRRCHWSAPSSPPSQHKCLFLQFRRETLPGLWQGLQRRHPALSAAPEGRPRRAQRSAAGSASAICRLGWQNRSWAQPALRAATGRCPVASHAGAGKTAALPAAAAVPITASGLPAAAAAATAAARGPACRGGASGSSSGCIAAAGHEAAQPSKA